MLRLRLTVDVSYDEGSVCPVFLVDQMERMAMSAIQDGGLTSYTDAEVISYLVKVEEL